MQLLLFQCTSSTHYTLCTLARFTVVMSRDVSNVTAECKTHNTYICGAVTISGEMIIILPGAGAAVVWDKLE